VAREIGGDPIGRAVWGQMKEAGAKAFAGSEETHGGMALLSELRGLQQQDYKTRVVLVGHSAGAIFICELLRAVAKQERHPGLRFDVVFLAPACTFKLLDDTLELATNFVGSFRCFAMQDALEQADWVLRPIYTRSLLYFVSGLLEGEPDEPIVGMARFHTRKSPFEDHSFPGIRRTLDRLAVHSKGWIWAIADGDRGAFMIPRAIDHLRSSLLPVRSTGRRMASGWRRSKRGSPQGTIAQPRASSNALQSEVDLTVRDCLRLRANWVRCTGARQQWHTS
jgi:hypothetical protein